MSHRTGYTARKSRQFPVDSSLRTPEFRAEEDHHEFSFSFRQECQWYEDKEVVRLFRKRGNPPIQGPRDMSPFVKRTDAHGCSLLECVLGKNVTSSILLQGGKPILSDHVWLVDSG